MTSERESRQVGHAKRSRPRRVALLQAQFLMGTASRQRLSTPFPPLLPRLPRRQRNEDVRHGSRRLMRLHRVGRLGPDHRSNRQSGPPSDLTPLMPSLLNCARHSSALFLLCNVCLMPQLFFCHRRLHRLRSDAPHIDATPAPIPLPRYPAPISCMIMYSLLYFAVILHTPITQ